MADESDVCIQWPMAVANPSRGLQKPLRLGVMASGEGSNFEALVAACRSGELLAEVVLLVVNQPGCGAIARAERLGVSHRLIDHRLRGSREQLDSDVVALFRDAAVDLVVMAGWMRIVTRVMIDAFPGRLINIHPSLLPSFRGRDGIGDALKGGVTLAGCTAHLVVPEVDAGPILVQAAVPVLADDNRERLHGRIRRQEHRILPLAVQLAAARLSGADTGAADQG
jgi:phosphoribosylglycinamide formyltransferase-1